MNKPRILVTAAAGKTGLPTALQLLEDGFPVTAFVRRKDKRSEHLKAAGAKVVIGSMQDVADMRRALQGAQRAYFCAPAREGYLTAAATFAALAADAGLEYVVAMSQWLSNPAHPSVQTREAWLSDRLLAQVPGCSLTLLNPGFFADNDMHVLPMAAQFGVLPLPYGSGKNAAPSNEDMGRVAAAVLARPEGHAGRTYRITGPALLSPEDIAATVGKVLGRKVRYVHAPLLVFQKVMKQMGMEDYIVAQFAEYALDYQKGAFAVGGPTDIVRQVTGREAEDYETVVRRYAEILPDARRSLGGALRLLGMSSAAMLRGRPDRARQLHLGDFSDREHAALSADSAEWHGSHDAPDGPFSAPPEPVPARPALASGTAAVRHA